MMQPVRGFFQKENFYWLFFSLFFALVSLFFISLGVKSLAPLMFFGLKIIYSAYFFGLLFFLGFLFYLLGQSAGNDYLIKKSLLVFLPTELILLW